MVVLVQFGRELQRRRSLLSNLPTPSLTIWLKYYKKLLSLRKEFNNNISSPSFLSYYLSNYLTIPLLLLFVVIYRDCKHVNVVEIYGICIQKPQVFIICEWVEGQNLEIFIKQNRDNITVRYIYLNLSIYLPTIYLNLSIYPPYYHLRSQ